MGLLGSFERRKAHCAPCAVGDWPALLAAFHLPTHDVAGDVARVGGHRAIELGTGIEIGDREGYLIRGSENCPSAEEASLDNDRTVCSKLRREVVAAPAPVLVYTPGSFE